jgi:ribosomal protein S18 acetylase RimI-like enzyme
VYRIIACEINNKYGLTSFTFDKLTFAFGVSVSICSCGDCFLKSITDCIEYCLLSFCNFFNNFSFGNFSEQVIEISTELPVTWDDLYFDAAVDVIHEGFKTASDALFDTRYLTKEGTNDILDKIVNGVYGEFLPESTSVLLYNGRPCGFCFTNITGGRIANIPLVSIKKEHQGKGLAKHLVKKSVEHILDKAHSGERDFTEVNVSAETNNIPALKMYRHIGFKEDYSYPQSYLPIA